MVNKAKAVSRRAGRKFLRTSFQDVQQVLGANLSLAARSISHDGVMGAVNEQHWIQLLRQYLPNRYACDTAIVIDSRGAVSDQIDIVIYDPQYTPRLLTQQSHRYVPAEAVYAVLEAKPTIDRKHLIYAGKKAASVRSLYRTSVAIPQIDGTSLSKQIFPIVAGIVASKVTWTSGFGPSFRRVLDSLHGNQLLDCGCGLTHGSFDRFADDGSITIGESDGSLIFFLFRLLGKLQSLGTAPAIDWSAYVSIFDAKRL